MSKTLLLLTALLVPVLWSQPPQKITINYPTRTGQIWPLYLAKEGGYYQKYGFDTNLVFGVHPAGIAMLVSNEAVMTAYTLEQAMVASSKDGSLIALGSPFKKSLFALMAQKGLTNVRSLKGKRIGVSQLGDAPYNYTIGLIGKAHLGPRDVQWIAIGGDVSARAAALVSGRVDAVMITAPVYFKLEAQRLSEPRQHQRLRRHLCAVGVSLQEEHGAGEPRDGRKADESPRRSHQALL